MTQSVSDKPVWRAQRTHSNRCHTLVSGVHEKGVEKEARGNRSFLDIKGAFPNVAVLVLVHDMRCMGFHPKYTEWITNKTTNHETILTFNNYVSQPFEVKHGLDQGCNLSPFLYNCYSAGQMKALNGKPYELGNTFADDGVCAASAANPRQQERRLATCSGDQEARRTGVYLTTPFTTWPKAVPSQPHERS